MQVVLLHGHFLYQGIKHGFPLFQLGAKVKITIMARLFAERNVKVKSRHNDAIYNSAYVFTTVSLIIVKNKLT